MSYKDLSARLRVQAENVEEDGWFNAARLMRGAADELEELKARNAELTKHLLITTEESWPYIHQWCSIDRVKKNWLDAREFLRGNDPKVNY